MSTAPLPFPASSQKVAVPALSARQERALAALVAGRTVTAAATAAGVTRRTVARWLRDDRTFTETLARERDRAFRAALDELRRVTTKAVKVAERMMAPSRPEETQLAAMRAVLALALKVNEQVDVDRRLGELEREAQRAD